MNFKHFPPINNFPLPTMVLKSQNRDYPPGKERFLGTEPGPWDTMLTLIVITTLTISAIRL